MILMILNNLIAIAIRRNQIRASRKLWNGASRAAISANIFIARYLFPSDGASRVVQSAADCCQREVTFAKSRPRQRSVVNGDINDRARSKTARILANKRANDRSSHHVKRLIAAKTRG